MRRARRSEAPLGGGGPDGVDIRPGACGRGAPRRSGSAARVASCLLFARARAGALRCCACRSFSLKMEREACDELRAENARLTHDIRSIASQMKQERAASNAVLAVRVGGASALRSSMPACSEELQKYDSEDGTIDTNGLTLASAASQAPPRPGAAFGRLRSVP